MNFGSMPPCIRCGHAATDHEELSGECFHTDTTTSVAGPLTPAERAERWSPPIQVELCHCICTGYDSGLDLTKPLCARCGHEYGEHIDTDDGLPAKCWHEGAEILFVDYEGTEQQLPESCDCEGYVAGTEYWTGVVQ